MDKDLLVSEWLGHMQSEYLSGFIRDGGSTIKFLVTESETRTALKSSLQDLTGDYVVVSLDATVTRFHMPQDIFWGIASQIDWRALARRFVLKLAVEAQFKVDSVNPGHIYEAIEKANDYPKDSVLSILRLELINQVFRNTEMNKDFRTAMLHLCLQEGTHDDSQYGGQPIIDWLTGVNPTASGVRPFAIHNKISRVSARHFLESALFWFRHVGSAGTVILLDNSRVTMPKNPKDGMKYYTRLMVLDHYELLRQFIDGIDRLSGTMILIATETEFVNQEQKPPARGFGIYPALMTRVMDDVRDRKLVNPVASLIRLR